MKSEILDKNRLTNIQMGMVWTLPEGTKFPDFTETSDIPDHWLHPTYIYLESGSRSGASDFLKYSGVHDTRDSWNPADWYGPGIIQALGLEPEAYQNLESVLLPELIDPEIIYDPENTIDESWSTNIRFFGNTTFLKTRMALLRLPADTWKIEFYAISGVSKNKGQSLILSEFQTPLEVYPVLRVTYGPDINLLNNPDDMYTRIPSGRSESVTSIEYKRQLDELRSEKILGIKFTSTGLERMETFNVSTGAWHLQKDSGQVPERHKSKYYLSKVKLADTHDIDVSLSQGKILMDPLSGVILGTSKVTNTPPVRDMIFSEIQSDVMKITYNPHVVYQTGDTIDYQGRDYYSEAPGNIDAHPVLSGLWSLTDPDFPELPGDYDTVSLYVEGPGDLQFPDTGVSMIGDNNRGYVGTTEGFIKLKIVPESGYILDSSNPFSFKCDTRVDNLVAEDNNIYTLRLGKDYGDSFSFRFIPIETSVITDFRVPGYNYYTYLGDSRYRDYGVSYNSLTGTDSDRVKVLPNGQGIAVSYVMASDESAIAGAKFESVEGILLRVPSSTDLVKSGQKIRMRYHGLLDRYDLTDWDTAVTAIYYNNSSSYEVSLSRASDEIGQDGSSLWIDLELLEAITHIRIDLVPRKVSVAVIASDIWQVSTAGEQVHVGKGFDVDIYGPSDQTPVVQTEAVTELERISSKLWKLHVTEIQVPTTINIS